MGLAPGSGQRRLAEATEALLREVAALLAGHPLAPLVGHWFRLVAPEEVLDAGAERLAGVLREHHSLGVVRTPGRAVVSARRGAVAGSGTAQQPRAAVPVEVLVVTDDMPFLVDSVTAELARLGLSLRSVVHPQVLVERDLAGHLLSVAPAESGASGASGTGLLPESWMWLVADAPLEGPAEDIEECVRRVLQDVRDAVEDWPRMRHRALALADEMAGRPEMEGASEAAGLLRWLVEDHFTFLGYREYDLVGPVGSEDLQARPGTGLGITRSDPRGGPRPLTPEARATARVPAPLVVTKANRRSTVHRRAYLDYIGIKDIDAQGRVVGERRFLGLFTASAYAQSLWSIPVLAAKAEAVFAKVGVSRSSHAGMDLANFLENYPREEMFQADAGELADVAQAVMHLRERRQTRLFLRTDRYGRFASALVYLPRDRYTTDVRLAMEQILAEAFDAESVDTTARVSESVLARLHVVVRLRTGAPMPDIDRDALEQRLAECTRSWLDDFSDALVARVGEQSAAGLMRRWSAAFPPAYRAERSPESGVEDVLRFEQSEGQDISVLMSDAPHDADATRRFTIYRRGPAMSLTEILPLLQHLGVEVVDERPHLLSPADDDRDCHVYDLGIRFDESSVPELHTLAHRFEEAFLAAWAGTTANFNMNATVTHVGLDVRQATILRAYARYLRQTRLAYSLGYVESTLVAHPDVTRLLVRLFDQRFDPTSTDSTAERERAQAATVQQVEEALESVPSLDADRILRAFLTLITATVRTNAFRRTAGHTSAALSFKMLAERLSDLIPPPRPLFEVWVHSPSVEGVHLRFGHVARGGLRWSDRPDDFRTEILGLVKAQMVKNAVIVPVGAKGGFVVQRPLDPSIDRDAWLAQGIECYRQFIRALLDITDNLIDDAIVPPVDVVRHDGDDAYLVVAADKGTATFSDHANALSAEYGFWLGDAFASGGSAGYDHKAMGITARGAWESVRRHFREMGRDVQSEDVTVVGIGDMSGDVFGNGMLLSPHIRLVAAFDHRHVFLDPDPDPAASFDERRRLFGLPRSSWDDYDRSLISAGGGVHSRQAKTIPLTDEVRSALAIDASVSSLTPNELLRAILRAPVDLLWNGGIGTYVKAHAESSLEVGDKANDSIRVDGRDLRARVVGEGGNLGFTQRGRIEAARAGVRLNTDAIDNSAGVDTSDHEVNIKILLGVAERRGRLARSDRDALLASMTDEVAALVLRDNYEQNVVLASALAQSASLLPVHRRMVQEWERLGRLDRTVENLPTEDEFAVREAAGEGLASPELAVLLAYAKIVLAEQLTADGFAEDPTLMPVLHAYFPEAVRQRCGDLMGMHPLRREIITTSIVNDIVNDGGITFAFRAMEETGASAAEVARAFLLARTVFGLDAFEQRIRALDGDVPAAAQVALRLEGRRLLDRSTRWFLDHGWAGSTGPAPDPHAVQERLGPVVSLLAGQVPDLLRGVERERWQRRKEEFAAMGAPTDLGAAAAALLDAFSLLDIATIATAAGADPRATAELYFRTSERHGVDVLLGRISRLPRHDRWSTLARGAVRHDLYEVLRELVSSVLASTPDDLTPEERLRRWELAHSATMSRAARTLEDIRRQDDTDLATISVALRSLRSLIT